MISGMEQKTLCLERDESLVSGDRQNLIEVMKRKAVRVPSPTTVSEASD